MRTDGVMSKESRLVKNTIIYAIGNISSKVLAYIMVMVYSHYIQPSDLGYYDVVISTISLLVPVIMLELHEGVYRLMIGNSKYSNEDVVGTSLIILLIASIVSESLLILFSLCFSVKLIGVISFYSFSYILYVYFITVIRGYSENKFYASLGVLNSFITLIVELIGVVILKQGIAAMFFAMGMANCICVLVVLIHKNNIFCCLSRKINKSLLSEILRYSIPLIPTTICWWIVDASDRYIILFNLGSEFNGIYAMSTKFPTLITAVTSIFYLAWQESAIKEYDSTNRDAFFTNVFRKYHCLLLSVCMCCIPSIKVIIKMFLSSEYTTSWMYTGPLFMATAYMAMSSFLGLGYQISKETKKSTTTSIVAALINATFNLLFIKLIGLYAASISTFVAYFILFLIRIKDTRKYFVINYAVGEMIILPILCLGLIATTFFVDSILFLVIETLCCVVVSAILNRRLLMPIFIKTKGIIR